MNESHEFNVEIKKDLIIEIEDEFQGSTNKETGESSEIIDPPEKTIISYSNLKFKQSLRK